MLSCLQEFQQFLEHSHHSANTLKHYLSDLFGFATWFEQTHGAPLSPEKISAPALHEFKGWLLRHKFQPNSINRKLATLRAFLRWADQAVPAETLAPAQVPLGEKQVRPGPRWLDRREQNALLRAVERKQDPRDNAFVKVLLHTGLRVQELCDLTWQDVLIQERKGMLTVRRGKGGQCRQVPLNVEARKALLGLGYRDKAGLDQPIFTGQRGPITPRAVQFALAKYAPALAAAGGRDTLSPHLLRHTFCKNLVEAGVDLPKVAALAGHALLETTRRYCEPSLTDLEQVVERLVTERGAG